MEWNTSPKALPVRAEKTGKAFTLLIKWPTCNFLLEKNATKTNVHNFLLYCCCQNILKIYAYPDLKATSSFSNFLFIFLPLMGLWALRHFVLLFLAKTKSAFQSLHRHGFFSLQNLSVLAGNARNIRIESLILPIFISRLF